MNRKMRAMFVIILGLLTGEAFGSEGSPSAGEQAPEIKALSKSQIDGLLAGKGMGYGKAAELNGYPGPAHVLELAAELSLTAEQRKDTEAIFARMEAAAKDLGAELVAAERALDQAFKSKVIDGVSLSKLAKDIGNVESRLRATHLNAHLQQTRILSDHQIVKYMTLRGHNRDGHGGHHNVE